MIAKLETEYSKTESDMFEAIFFLITMYINKNDAIRKTTNANEDIAATNCAVVKLTNAIIST
jgi:hypothetical protein